jgi:membrane-associated PAP2 superfamily phosphatase
MLFTRRGFFVTLALLVIVAGVFALWPNLDLAVSHALHIDGEGFVGRGPVWAGVRLLFRVLPFVTLAAFAALFCCRWRGMAVPYAPSGRALVFLAATLAIGPGLIVNLGLKDHAHRPRPTQTQDFGGPYEFRPWYRFDGGCKKNCSFVSGEASQGFWMLAPASLAPPPFEPLAIGAALVIGVAASFVRLAQGGHYLSDVMLAGLLTILILQIARWLTFRGRSQSG